MSPEAQQRLVFGRDRDIGVAEELIEGTGARVRDGKGRYGALKENPLIPLYGPGPEGAICRDCVHLERHAYGSTWFKCDLRRNTSSNRTDHRAKWPACGKFEAESEMGGAP